MFNVRKKFNGLPDGKYLFDYLYKHHKNSNHKVADQANIKKEKVTFWLSRTELKKFSTFYSNRSEFIKNEEKDTTDEKIFNPVYV